MSEMTFCRLVIVNAIFFKGDWLFKFDEEKTEPMVFHVDDDRRIDHPFGMKLVEALRMAYIEELGADVLEMPYKVFQLPRFHSWTSFFVHRLWNISILCTNFKSKFVCYYK